MIVMIIIKIITTTTIIIIIIIIIIILILIVMVGQFRLTFQITVKLKRVDLKVQNFVWRISDQGSFKTVKFVGTQ